MPTTGLRGPYPLDTETIDKEVKENSIGAYARARARAIRIFQTSTATSTNPLDKSIKHDEVNTKQLFLSQTTLGTKG